MTLRQQIQEEMATRVDPRVRRRMVSRMKARAVTDAFQDHPGRNQHGIASIRTRAGEARIAKVEYIELDDGNSCVEVWTGTGNGPPQFRIFNPPTLVEDRSGDIELNDRKYREDPLAALAEVVAGGKR